MSPTVFDAGAKKKQRREAELQKQLHELQAERKASTTLPEREENVIQEPLRAERHPEDYSEVLKGNGRVNGLFSAFMTQPENVHFETQHKSEKVLMLLRQHPIVNVKWIFIAILLIVGPSFLLSLYPFLQFLPAQFSFFASIGWILFIVVYIIESFLSWYYNIYIITDERIIDIDFYSLLYRSVAEAKLEKIEDVTATMAGMGGAVFDYGTITIQTAAEKREFEFVKVPHPARVTKFLNELIIEEEREKIEGRVS